MHIHFTYGGSLARTEATGYGLLYITDALLRDHNIDIKGKTVAVSGEGNVAIYAIEKAQQLGAKVVTCSDSTGWIYDPDGIDVALLKEIKEVRRERLTAYKNARLTSEYHEGRGVWQIKCDIALPCATQNELTLDDAKMLAAVMLEGWTIVFQIIKHTVGLRASEQEEILGMDATEHGLVSSYADFMPAMSEAAIAGYVKDGAKSVAKAPAAVPADVAVPVENNVPNDVKPPKMTKISVVFNQEKLHHFIHAMERIGITGVTVTNVMGCGIQKTSSYYRGAKMSATLHPKIKAEIVVCKVPVDTVVKTAREVLYTGQVGDGKIFIYPVERVIKVRTGSVNYDALQSEELPETN